MLKYVFGIVVFGWAVQVAPAQLAITESMSSATTSNPWGVARGPDFWELSNFGDSTIDLTGYKFNDDEGGLTLADGSPFQGIVIGPGESVLLAQSDVMPVSTPEQFRAWWGLPETQQVVFYSGNGQSAGGDFLVLYGPDAVDDEDYLDKAVFGAAAVGQTFTYDPANGNYGIYSSNGVNFAFTAAQTGDVGSPGTNTGPVALVITQHPTNTTGYAGFPVTLYAVAQGLPRPRYQWLFNDEPIDGARGPTLTITNVQPENAGAYHVVITNGLETVTTSNATLIVDSSPVAPTFLITPKDIEAYVGQSVTLTAAAQGNPAPSYQWHSNGVALAGQTANQLTLFGVQISDSAEYSVMIYNVVGTNAAAATVTITTKPKLVITEAHSTGNSAGSPAFEDWWELTNFDDRPINLKGYRFDDNSQSLAAVYTFPNDVIIQPGETIILAETTLRNGTNTVSPEIFRNWWGTDKIPVTTQIIIYQIGGISFSSGGDAIYLWNAAATTDFDFICGVTFGSAAGNPRRTFVWNPDAPSSQSPIPGLLDTWATNDVNGAFAATTGDIGSPGRIVTPLQLHIAPTSNGVALSWDSVPGRDYTVDFKTNLTDTIWNTFSNVIATADSTVIADEELTTSRVYRLRLNLSLP